MKRAKYSVGKRFSLREAEQITIDGLDFWLEQIDWNEVFTASTIDRYKAKALDVLRVEKVPLKRLLEESPHGSMVRDFVLNFQDSPHDSLPVLAARLLEHALHIEAYKAMPGAEGRVASLAFRFGRLATLFDVYEIVRGEQSTKAQIKRSAKADNGESIHQIIERLAIAHEHRDEQALQLWPRFFGELDRLGLAPALDESGSDPKKWRIEYDHKDSVKTMTFGTFANRVTRHRSKKSR